MYIFQLAADPQQIAILAVFGVFIVILVLFSIIKSAMGGKGYKQVKEAYSDKIVRELNYKYYQGFLTQDELFLCEKNKKVVSVYAISDISSVRSSRDKSVGWSFCLYDDGNKPLRGDVTDGKTRKPRKIGIQYPLKQKEADELADLLMNMNPGIRRFSRD
ncbi:MAG: hypothetical protein IJ757_08375 [Clostridiales bacterium]|nr:hypothetical protein [Clostridiales bacterium]